MRSPEKIFVVCLQNKGYEVSLEPRKLYQVLPDPDAAIDTRQGQWRERYFSRQARQESVFPAVAEIAALWRCEDRRWSQSRNSWAAPAPAGGPRSAESSSVCHRAPAVVSRGGAGSAARSACRDRQRELRGRNEDRSSDKSPEFENLDAWANAGSTAPDAELPEPAKSRTQCARAAER